MSRYWSPIVSALHPYVAGEQPQGSDVVKLNTNESPFPPSPAVEQALRDFDSGSLRLYPDPESTELRQCIADYHGVGIENVFVGNGSDEVLAHAFYAFFKQEAPIIFPDITYSFYKVYCELHQIAYELLALDENYEIPLASIPADNGGVIFANPNAPTGRLLERSDVASMLAKIKNSVVLVDEAYIDFAPPESSAIELVPQFDNLLVTRTLSKSRSLAGIRLGYAIGSAALIEGLIRVKDSFNSYPIDRLASALAIASFADEPFLQACIDDTRSQRSLLVQSLLKLGYRCLPSEANFVLMEVGDAAAELFASLRERGVVVRYFDKPRLSQFLRVTIGSEAQNRRFLDAVTQWHEARA